MIYSIVFLWAILLASFIPRNSCKYGLICFLSIILLMPIFCIGGFRDVTIGCDTQAYPVSAYYFVQQSHNWMDYFTTDVEAMYLFTAYLVYNYVSTDFSALLFTTNAIIVGVFYVGLLNLKQSGSFRISILLFLCLFFNMFLSMQRQGLAMAFVFLGITFLLKRQVLITILCIIIGFGFHKSAIMSSLCIPILYCQKATLNKYVLIGIAVFVCGFSVALNFFTGFEAFAKYDTYGTGGEYSEGAFSLSELILRVVLLGVFWLGVSKKYKNPKYYAYLTILLCDFMVNLLQLKSAYVGRLGYYFYMCYLFILPQYLFNRNIFNKNKFVYQSLVVLIVVVYWYFIYIYKEASMTYPYSSVILNIKD